MNTMQNTSGVVALYRGENPYLQSIVEACKAVGIYVEEHQIPRKAVVDDSLHARILEIVEKGLLEQQRVVLVDDTIYFPIRNPHSMTEDEALQARITEWQEQYVIQVYETLNRLALPPVEHIAVMQSVTQAIRDAGLTPVLMQYGISDHINNLEMYELFNEKQKAMHDKLDTALRKTNDGIDIPDNFRRGYRNIQKFTPVLATHLELPMDQIIPLADFDAMILTQDTRNYDPEILQDRVGSVLHNALRERNIDSAQAVLLTDHHIYNLEKRLIPIVGLDEIPITPICTCCIDNTDYLPSFQVRNFSTSATQDRRDRAIQLTIQRIQKLLSNE